MDIEQTANNPKPPQRPQRGQVVQATAQPSPLPPFFDQRKIKRRTLGYEAGGFLGSMRIRKKLILLHTFFSLVLAGLLLLALRPAMNEVVDRAEADEAGLLLETILPSLAGRSIDPSSPPRLPSFASARIKVYSGTASDLSLDAKAVSETSAVPGSVVSVTQSAHGPGAAAMVVVRGETVYHLLTVELPQTRASITMVYWFVVSAIFAMYGLVALTLEMLVLPQAVYVPIQRMLIADLAVQGGRKEDELIPEDNIPSDELGEIMRSRNDTVIKLRKQESMLAEALSQLEQVATDLKRKNHLLEAAQRNLAESDRLASLGMMSAGIAHELNTPLAVLKGLVEKINGQPDVPVGSTQAHLMFRVVGRLEKLGESLLDFARVRPPSSLEVPASDLVQEAITLVRLDRETSKIDLINTIPPDVALFCDPDRIIQVLVNLIRNAADAIVTGMPGSAQGTVRVEAHTSLREGRMWTSILIIDDGPGIDAGVLPHLFEPFVSTRLDSRGTGLGLAVSEGIVREHGGLLLARNRSDSHGAIFEIILPASKNEPVSLA